MLFVGIIEQNWNIINEITQYFLGFENYSLLFICSSFEEYKTLPVGKRNKAGIVIVDAAHQNAARIWQVRYLKQVNLKSSIFLLSENTINDQLLPKLQKAGVDSVLDKKAITKDLAGLFGNGLKVNNNGPAGSHIIKSHQNGKKIPLTTREFEIAELIGKGYTNKKIGELLFISPYTVNAHLRNIYMKLSVCSRTALVNHIINEL